MNHPARPHNPYVRLDPVPHRPAAARPGLRGVYHATSKEIRDQYLDESKGAPFRQKVAIETKIVIRIYFTTLFRWLGSFFGSARVV